MHLPKKTLDIVVKQNTYTVNFPNNRVLMSIFARKAQLANEMYDSLSLSMDGNARYIALLIDAIATFEKVMPEQFFKDLNIEKLVDLDVIQGAELVKIYTEQYQKWFDQWTSAISSVLKGTEGKQETSNVGQNSGQQNDA